MKEYKGMVIGFLISLFVFSSFSFGLSAMQNIDVSMNAINISVEGVQKAQIGESYKLENGDKVPYSISYKGTTYLPIR